MHRLAPALLVLVLLIGCAPKNRPAIAPSESLPATGSAAARLARSLVGTPYRYGGTTPDGFDCSGFVQYVFGELGVGLPRDARDQADSGERVDRDDLREGDAVFFAIDGHTISHVGIVIGADSFVHAPSSGGRVREERLSLDYWQSRFAGARRFVRD